MDSSELNPIESVLQCYNHRGLSIKQLEKITQLCKRTITYHIYTSTFIEDTQPCLHGSTKSKINVYNYTPDAKKYFQRKMKKLFNLFF